MTRKFVRWKNQRKKNISTPKQKTALAALCRAIAAHYGIGKPQP